MVGVSVTVRAVAGFLLSFAVAAAALRLRALSRSGAVAAVAVGTISVAAGWSWAVLLLSFFAPSSALSRMRVDIRESRTAAVIANRGARDWAQVLANGGLFAIAAGLSLATMWPGWLAAGAGSLAAATADTWATEIGTLSLRTPVRITDWRPVPPGTSGGITITGTAASVAGAVFIAVVAWVLQWPELVVVGAFLGGVIGSSLDSVIGALWQSKRRCATCQQFTERRVHSCGEMTGHVSGLEWLENDEVNLLCTLAGAAVAVIVLEAG